MNGPTPVRTSERKKLVQSRPRRLRRDGDGEFIKSLQGSTYFDRRHYRYPLPDFGPSRKLGVPLPSSETSMALARWFSHISIITAVASKISPANMHTAVTPT